MAETAGSKSSTSRVTHDRDARTAQPRQQRIAIGRVSGVHGLHGNLNIRYTGGDPENLLGCSSVWLADAEDDPTARAYDVVSVAPGRRSEVRMRLEGVDDRSAAEDLKGQLVLVAVDQLSELAGGEYYSYQLVGCRVFREDGRPIGSVAEIWSTGAPDIAVVDDGTGRQHLIPAALMREVDIEQRRIVVEVLPGLIDDD
jgi:16S rRNA processing protein RimM